MDEQEDIREPVPPLENEEENQFSNAPEDRLVADMANMVAREPEPIADEQHGGEDLSHLNLPPEQPSDGENPQALADQMFNQVSPSVASPADVAEGTEASQIAQDGSESAQADLAIPSQQQVAGPPDTLLEYLERLGSRSENAFPGQISESGASGNDGGLGGGGIDGPGGGESMEQAIAGVLSANFTFSMSLTDMLLDHEQKINQLIRALEDGSL